MIFGNVAYLGSLSRRSAVITAGSLILIVSKPPSISRVTVKPSPVFSNFDANVAYTKMSQLRLVAKVMKHVANAHWNDSQSPSILPTNLISQFPPVKVFFLQLFQKRPFGDKSHRSLHARCHSCHKTNSVQVWKETQSTDTSFIHQLTPGTFMLSPIPVLQLKSTNVIGTCNW